MDDFSRYGVVLLTSAFVCVQSVKTKWKRRRGLMHWRRGKLMKGATSHRRRMSAHSQQDRCVFLLHYTCPIYGELVKGRYTKISFNLVFFILPVASLL